MNADEARCDLVNEDGGGPWTDLVAIAGAAVPNVGCQTRQRREQNRPSCPRARLPLATVCRTK